MADALVALLNRYGYQPVLARSGLEPPELYTYERAKNGLAMRRRGELKHYLPTGTAFVPDRHEMFDAITGQSTSSKNLQAATTFLKRVLECVGLTSFPKFDLSFAGTHEFRFSISGVTGLEIDPAVLEPHLKSLDLSRIAPDLIEKGRLFVAYEYLYATTVVVERADGKRFATATEGKVGEFFDVGGKASVESKDQSKMSFRRDDGTSAAFGMRLGRVDVRQGRRFLSLEDTDLGPAAVSESRSIIPRRNLVLTVVEQDA